MKQINSNQELINKQNELKELLRKAEELGYELSKLYGNKVRQSEKDMDAAFDNHDKDAYTESIAEYNMATTRFEAFKRITHTINDINF